MREGRDDKDFFKEDVRIRRTSEVSESKVQNY